MTRGPNSANPRRKTVHGFLLLLPSLLAAPPGRISIPLVGATAHFHLLSPPVHCLALVISCFRVLSAPSRVPKEVRREAVELQPPKLPPKKPSLCHPGDLDATADPRKRLLQLSQHHHHSPVHQTLNPPQASPPSRARLLRLQPSGRANR